MMTEDDTLLVQALVDDELDALSAAALEARFAAEPGLAAAYSRLLSLREQMRAIPAARAPDALRERIHALAKQTPATGGAPTQAVPKRASWPVAGAMAASLLIGVGAGWFGTTLTRPTEETRALVTSHVRGLVAGRPFDVESSDSHTVRPWFAGKIAVAPFVVDLASDGFPLEGGRVDVVDGVAEPTLVYRRGQHTISVTRLPTSSEAAGALRPARRTVDGHAALAWRGGDATYLAISDAASGELDALQTAFERARQAGR